jgi:hypothetical protein
MNNKANIPLVVQWLCATLLVAAIVGVATTIGTVVYMLWN